MKTNRPKLGTWHTITGYLVKTHPSYNNATIWSAGSLDNYMPERGQWVYHGEENPPPSISWENKWKWEREPVTECKAMYCGYRYKKNGEIYYDEDNYFGFEQRETFEVWMFITHENRKPIPVLPFEVGRFGRAGR